MLNLRKFGFFIVCVLFVLLITARIGEIKSLSQFSSSKSAKGFDAEAMLLDGSIALQNVGYFLETSDYHVLSALNSGLSKTRLNGDLLKGTSTASLDIKHQILKCLMGEGFPSEVAVRLSNIKECSHSVAIAKGLRRKLSHYNDRRFLLELSSASAPVPSPAPAPSPATTSPASSSVSSPVAEVESSPPNSSSDLSPGNSQSSSQEFSTPQAAQLLHHHHKFTLNQLLIITTVLSIGGTTLVIACIFFCYKKCRGGKNNAIHGKDHKPPVNLGPSKISGSPSNYFEIDGAINKDKLRSIPFNSGSSSKTLSACVYTNGLPLPPGMKSPSLNSISASPATHQLVLPSVPAPPPPPPPPPTIHPVKIGATSPALPPPPPPIPTKKSVPEPPPPNDALPGCGRPFPLENKISNQISGADGDEDVRKTKLKPFFWDKVLANPDHSMVWHHIKAGSFQFREEMIETLFGYNSTGKTNGETEKESSASDHSIQLLDPKKSQNLSISLKALNVKTQDVLDALMQGNELPTELLQILLRMQPTKDEELKLKSYTGSLSQLGPAEQFLKVLVDIPFPFKRMEVLLFMSTLHEEALSIKDSFATLEVACNELRGNRLFLKLLEAVLKTGNRMNDGTYRGDARAFKLDTLLKLSDVKGSDGKTTLLHFVVLEIIRSEGVRAARLTSDGGSSSSLSYNAISDDSIESSLSEIEDHYYRLGIDVVSGLSSELQNVKRSAVLDIDELTNMITTFSRSLVNVKEFLNTDMQILEEDSGFHESLKCFIEHAEASIKLLLEEEKRIRLLIQNTTEYFYGSRAKDEGLHLFVVVRDFLGMLDNVCKEIAESNKRVVKRPKQRSNDTTPPLLDPRQLLFLAITDRHDDSSGSDEEDEES